MSSISKNEVLRRFLKAIDGEFAKLHSEQKKEVATSHGNRHLQRSIVQYRLARRIEDMASEYIQKNGLENFVKEKGSLAKGIAQALYESPLKQLDINDIYGPYKKYGISPTSIPVLDTLYHQLYGAIKNWSAITTPDYVGHKETIINKMKEVFANVAPVDKKERKLNSEPPSTSHGSVYATSPSVPQLATANELNNVPRRHDGNEVKC